MSASSHEKTKAPLLGDKSYDVLKKSATVLLPAAGALYFALAQIWGLPQAEEVVGSIAALNTFVGVLVGISSKTYHQSDAKYAGEIQIDDTGETKKISLVVNGDPDQIDHMNEATFKVNRPEA
ncbi:holin [Streptomyces phage LibertyBell]|nr:holin [Streptomyces phage LibertyBell]